MSLIHHTTLIMALNRHSMARLPRLEFGIPIDFKLFDWKQSNGVCSLSLHGCGRLKLEWAF